MAVLHFAAAAQAQVAHYRAEGDFADSSGNGHTATVNGTVGFRPGVPGFGQAFDLVPPSFLSVPTLSAAGASNLSGTGFTVAAYFTEDAFSSTGSLVSLRPGTNNSGFTLEPRSGIPGTYQFGVFTSAGYQFIDVPGFTVGTTYHIAGVFDPGNQLLSVYRDGLLVSSAPATNTPMLIGNNEDLLIGRNPVNGAGFDGMIDEVRLYDRALPASEVFTLVPEPVSSTFVLVPVCLFLVRRLRRRRVLSSDLAA